MANDNPESAPGDASAGSRHAARPDRVPPSRRPSTGRQSAAAAGTRRPLGHYQSGPVPAGRRLRTGPDTRRTYGPPAFGQQAYGQPAYGQPGYGRRARRPRPCPPPLGRLRGRAAGAASAPIAAVGLVTALLGGGVGGYVGYESARAARDTGRRRACSPSRCRPRTRTPHRSARSRPSPPGCCPASSSCRSKGSARGRRGLGHRARAPTGCCSPTTTSSRPRRTAAGSSRSSTTAPARPRRSSGATPARTSRCCGLRASPD